MICVKIYKKRKTITADFETITNPKDLRVWAWAVCNIEDTEDYLTGNSIESFFFYCVHEKIKRAYFHNLKFDGEYILYYLLSLDFQYTNSRKLKPGQFTTLIADTGQFYCIRCCIQNIQIEFFDSLKIITMSVEEVAKTFSLPINKLHIDYEEYRPPGHILTPIEKAYVINDARIMAMALHDIFQMGHTKMTQGANALADYKSIIGNKFDTIFPIPEYDADIRQSYKGGWCYLNPKYKGVEVYDGIVLDVNSLYPSRMYYEELPWGKPVAYKGKYQGIPNHPLYIQMFRCEFTLKPSKLPTIQLKGNIGFTPTEYVESSNGDTITLCLCSVDLHLFLEHYNVTNLEFISGWAFRSSTTLFKSYIDKWIGIKIQAEKDGNKGLRQWAKIMLNSLYGKFALNPLCAKKIPYLEDDIVKYHTTPKETRKPLYLPVGSFITAYARNYTIRSAQKIRDYSVKVYGEDMFIYSDTDSIHTLLPVTDVKNILDVDPYRLGTWKIEKQFDTGKFLRAKTYIESEYGKMSVTCCGMPKNVKQSVTWDNFWFGAEYQGKLMPRHFKGGVALIPSTFKIMGD